jgi:hypothetical protein
VRGLWNCRPLTRERCLILNAIRQAILTAWLFAWSGRQHSLGAILRVFGVRYLTVTETKDGVRSKRAARRTYDEAEVDAIAPIGIPTEDEPPVRE